MKKQSKKTAAHQAAEIKTKEQRQKVVKGAIVLILAAYGLIRFVIDITKLFIN